MHISQLSKWTFPLQNIIQFSLSVEFFWKMIDLVQHLLKVHGFLCDSFNMHALNIHSQAPGEHQRPAKEGLAPAADEFWVWRQYKIQED